MTTFNSRNGNIAPSVCHLLFSETRYNFLANINYKRNACNRIHTFHLFIPCFSDRANFLHLVDLSY